MGKAASWLKEERRKTLIAAVAVRYVDAGEAELPAACPQCEGELRVRCPECGARFSSAFAVECEACGAALRPPELLGMPIRKSATRRAR